jgi:sterol desaturase/sphingolipid hydroxylase (fatty acid hydroxylase superfamily)
LLITLLNYSPVIILVLLSIAEAAAGGLDFSKSDRDETALDLASIAFPLVSRPAVFAIVIGAAAALAPEWRDKFGHWSWVTWIPVYLLGEDMVQYWWHRLGHTRYTWLWHRAHHSAPYMGARMTFRNGFLYSFLMPNIWTNAFFVYLGAGPFAVAYGLVKLAVVIAAHSELRWDQYLYRSSRLSPLAWIVERTISTPATHFAHHALSESDGVGHYSGNFGNLLFFWDVLFGTALITRHYPPAFGVESDLQFGRERWWVQLFVPLVGSQRLDSDYKNPSYWFSRMPSRGRLEQSRA